MQNKHKIQIWIEWDGKLSINSYIIVLVHILIDTPLLIGNWEVWCEINKWARAMCVHLRIFEELQKLMCWVPLLSVKGEKRKKTKMLIIILQWNWICVRVDIILNLSYTMYIYIWVQFGACTYS